MTKDYSEWELRNWVVDSYDSRIYLTSPDEQTTIRTLPAPHQDMLEIDRNIHVYDDNYHERVLIPIQSLRDLLGAIDG